MPLLRIYSTVIIFLVFISLQSDAQKIKLSADNIEDNTLDYIKVIGQNDDGIFLLNSNLSLESQRDRIGLRTRKYKLSFFDNTLRPLWYKNVSPHPDNATVESVSFFNDKFIVLESDWNKNDNSLNLLIDVYDSKGTLIINGRKIGSCTVDKSASLSKPRLIVSAGKSFAGVYLEEDRGQEQVIHFIICDTTFKAIEQRKSVIPYPEKDTEISAFVLSDQLDFLLMAQMREANAPNEKKKLRTFRVFLSRKAENNFKEFKVNDATHQMSEAAIAIDRSNNNAVVTGFYADKSSFAGSGILFASLSLSNPDKLDFHAYPLSGSAQIKLLGERNAGNNLSLFSYPIQKVVLRSDGGAIVIAEAAYQSEYSYYDYFNQSFNTRIEYHYDNVVVLSVSSKGEIDWSQVVRKDQVSVDDDGIYASFTTLLSPDELGIIYNADVGRNNEVVSFGISNKGQSTVTKLSKPGENISIIPRAGKQIDEDTIITPAYNRKKLYLAKITFE